MSGDVDEIAAAGSEVLRKARKEHCCTACKETIRVGDYYFVISMVHDGSASSWKRCWRCQKMHLHLRTLGDPGEQIWPDEQLDCGEEYEQHWGFPPPAEIAALAFVTAEEMREEARVLYEKNLVASAEYRRKRAEALAKKDAP